jgi:hypothetical protein
MGSLFLSYKWPSIGQWPAGHQHRRGSLPPGAIDATPTPKFFRSGSVSAARVRDAVAVAVDRYGITAERVAEAMARLAFTELRQIVDVHSVVVGGQHRRVVDVKDFSDIDGDAHQAIAEVRKTAGGELTVKLFNKREALMDLARLKGWIADKPVDQRSLVMLKIER